MSTVVQVGGFDPEAFWRAGALPLAVVFDLALGHLPGRLVVVREIRGFAANLAGRVGGWVDRLGGGRGGELFGCVLLVVLVVGTVMSLVYLAVDRADAAGGPFSLAVRTLVIALGLSIRTTGDALLQGIEATDPAMASRWFAVASGEPIRTRPTNEVDRVAVALTGDSIAAVAVAPFFWLAVGGPTALWGFWALRSLGLALGAEPRPASLLIRGPRRAADVVIVPGSILGAVLVVLVALGLRLLAGAAARWALLVLRRNHWTAMTCSRAALAGALGVQVEGGVISEVGGAIPLVGDKVRPADDTIAALGVRIFQGVALIAASLALLAGLLKI